MTTNFCALLTPQRLRAWLDRHQPEESVGLPIVSHQCPVARYLREATGRPWRVAGPSAHPLGPKPPPKSIPLPLWAYRLTYLVDMRGGVTISAQEASECVEQALFDSDVD